MFQKYIFRDRFLNGLLVGIVLPIITAAILFLFNEQLLQSGKMDTGGTGWPGFKDSTLWLIAICSNLIPTFFANKRLMDEFTRGIMVVTVLASFAWFFKYDPMSMFG